MKKLMILLSLLVLISKSMAQDRLDLLNELENTFIEYSEDKEFKENKVYYNVEEKILDAGNYLVDLKTTKARYSIFEDPDGTIFHILQFKCENQFDGCIQKSEISKFSLLNIYFLKKEGVYKAIDIIHKLKKLE